MCKYSFILIYTNEREVHDTAVQSDCNIVTAGNIQVVAVNLIVSLLDASVDTSCNLLASC